MRREDLSSIVAGICRHCGCTEDDPCGLCTGEPCSWADATRSVCNNPSCMKAEAARKRLIAAARPPGQRTTSANGHARTLPPRPLSSRRERR